MASQHASRATAALVALLLTAGWASVQGGFCDVVPSCPALSVRQSGAAQMQAAGSVRARRRRRRRRRQCLPASLARACCQGWPPCLVLCLLLAPPGTRAIHKPAHPLASCRPWLRTESLPLKPVQAPTGCQICGSRRCRSSAHSASTAPLQSSARYGLKGPLEGPAPWPLVTLHPPHTLTPTFPSAHPPACTFVQVRVVCQHAEEPTSWAILFFANCPTELITIEVRCNDRGALAGEAFADLGRVARCRA